MPHKSILKSYFLNHKSSLGFTLIELLVVIIMLSILLMGLIIAFNPVAQYNKAKDAQREHDLGQIQRALDSYFNDTHCYPSSLTFGQKWSVNNQIYMEMVPQDSDCSSTGVCYVYETDTTSSCPQWNVLYTALKGPSGLTTACSLVERNKSTACIPNGFTANKYNYCLLSGDVDCSVISGLTITVGSGGGGGGSGGGGGGGGGGNPPATPTPTGIVCPGNQYTGCTGITNSCNSIGNASDCTQNGGSKAFCYCDAHCNQSCPGGN